MSSIEYTLPAAWGSYARILHETLGSPTHLQSTPRWSCPANCRCDNDKRSWQNTRGHRIPGDRPRVYERIHRIHSEREPARLIAKSSKNPLAKNFGKMIDTGGGGVRYSILTVIGLCWGRITSDPHFSGPIHQGVSPCPRLLDCCFG